MVTVPLVTMFVIVIVVTVAAGQLTGLPETVAVPLAHEAEVPLHIVTVKVWLVAVVVTVTVFAPGTNLCGEPVMVAVPLVAVP